MIIVTEALTALVYLAIMFGGAYGLWCKGRPMAPPTRSKRGS
jgi:hypothetical protein